jgi:hypothetical protein
MLKRTISNVQVHNVEDLLKKCKEMGACPYFVSRSIANTYARLILGPYNYIIDPVIRKSMMGDLEGSILIFDEAHNIEDVARASASFEITLQTVQEARRDAADIPEDRQEAFGIIEEALGNLHQWLANFAVAGQDSTSVCTELNQKLVPKAARTASTHNRLCHARNGPFSVNGDRVEGIWSGGEVCHTLGKALSVACSIMPASSSKDNECIVAHISTHVHQRYTCCSASLFHGFSQLHC